MTTDRFDAVVVGGGPSGCVIAARLGQSGRRVLLIEAGPGEPRPASVSGLDTIAAAEEPLRQWSNSQVRDSAGAPLRRYRQGFGLGGGSMINSLLLTPGDRSDYQRWEQRNGCQGWGPDDMAPWLAKAARDIPGASISPGPVSTGFELAAQQFGHRDAGSSMDADGLGVHEARLAIDGRSRRSAVDAYFPGADHLPDTGVQLLTDTPVVRLIVQHGRAAGVECADGRQIRSPLVVVCAGAIRTPALLQASGLGGELVGVGLRDHPSFTFTLALRQNQAGPQPLRAISRLLRWSSGHNRSGDLQAFAIDRVDDPAVLDQPNPMAVVVVGLMQVSSTGRVGPVQSDGSPTVLTGALSTADDRERLRAGVRDVHRLLDSEPIQDVASAVYIDDQGTRATLLDAMDDEQLDSWICNHPGPYSHPASSCAMGPDSFPDAITRSEPELAGALRGYRGVYLGDASILPDLVQGGLQVPVVAVAERVAAGIIALGD